jgi:hypothetical protein
MYHDMKLDADRPAGAGEWIRAGRGLGVSAVGSSRERSSRGL